MKKRKLATANRSRVDLRNIKTAVLNNAERIKACASGLEADQTQIKNGSLSGNQWCIFNMSKDQEHFSTNLCMNEGIARTRSQIAREAFLYRSLAPYAWFFAADVSCTSPDPWILRGDLDIAKTLATTSLVTLSLKRLSRRYGCMDSRAFSLTFSLS